MLELPVADLSDLGTAAIVFVSGLTGAVATGVVERSRRKSEAERVYAERLFELVQEINRRVVELGMALARYAGEYYDLELPEEEREAVRRRAHDGVEALQESSRDIYLFLPQGHVLEQAFVRLQRAAFPVMQAASDAALVRSAELRTRAAVVSAATEELDSWTPTAEARTPPSHDLESHPDVLAAIARTKAGEEAASHALGTFEGAHLLFSDAARRTVGHDHASGSRATSSRRTMSTALLVARLGRGRLAAFRR